MNEKRYQVFISSTFRDLKDERQAVLESILHLRHIPVGMEIFPAADSTPWELIKQIISDSDYYVLIIAGRYGSLDADGISYTEREYALAVELGKPVLAFLHASPESLPFDKNEPVKKARRKLEAFRKSVEKHHCNYWRDISELKSGVVLGLVLAIQSHPTIGWVRANGYNDTELLRRLAELQQRHDNSLQETQLLRERLGSRRDTAGYAQGDARIPITFRLVHRVTSNEDAKTESVLLSWDELFLAMGMELLVTARMRMLAFPLSRIIFEAYAKTMEFSELKPASSLEEFTCMPTIQTIETIVKQLAALGLIEPHPVSITKMNNKGESYPTVEDGWRLTMNGRDKYFSSVALIAPRTSDTSTST